MIMIAGVTLAVKLQLPVERTLRRPLPDACCTSTSGRGGPRIFCS